MTRDARVFNVGPRMFEIKRNLMRYSKHKTQPTLSIVIVIKELTMPYLV